MKFNNLRFLLTKLYWILTFLTLSLSISYAQIPIANQVKMNAANLQPKKSVPTGITTPIKTSVIPATKTGTSRTTIRNFGIKNIKNSPKNTSGSMIQNPNVRGLINSGRGQQFTNGTNSVTDEAKNLQESVQNLNKNTIRTIIKQFAPKETPNKNLPFIPKFKPFILPKNKHQQKTRRAREKTNGCSAYDDETIKANCEKCTEMLNGNPQKGQECFENLSREIKLKKQNQNNRNRSKKGKSKNPADMCYKLEGEFIDACKKCFTLEDKSEMRSCLKNLNAKIDTSSPQSNQEELQEELQEEIEEEKKRQEIKKSNQEKLDKIDEQKKQDEIEKEKKRQEIENSNQEKLRMMEKEEQQKTQDQLNQKR